MVEEEDGDGSRDENGKWKYASNVNENVTKWKRTIDFPLVEGTFHERFFRVFLNLKRNNGDIKAQSFNKMMNKMTKSSIKMKNPQLNLKRENLY